LFGGIGVGKSILLMELFNNTAKRQKHVVYAGSERALYVKRVKERREGRGESEKRVGEIGRGGGESEKRVVDLCKKRRV
jgi:predicted ATP-dependent serine protease